MRRLGHFSDRSFFSPPFKASLAAMGLLLACGGSDGSSGLGPADPDALRGLPKGGTPDPNERPELGASMNPGLPGEASSSSRAPSIGPSSDRTSTPFPGDSPSGHDAAPSTPANPPSPPPGSSPGVPSSPSDRGQPPCPNSPSGSCESPSPRERNRCGIRGRSITLDGQEAFTYFFDDDRLKAQLQLQRSGACKADPRLGIRGTAITIDGTPAFTYVDVDDRKEAFIKLATAVPSFGPRCSISGSSFVLDGQAGLSYFDTDDRLDAFLKFQKLGLCSGFPRVGLRSGAITIGGEIAFAYPSTDDRERALIDLVRASPPAERPTAVCGVRGPAITIDGEDAHTFFDVDARHRFFVRLLQDGTCSLWH